MTSSLGGRLLRSLSALGPGLCFFCVGTAAFAQSAQSVDARLNALDAATKSAQLSGDNAWMLTSAALVLMMTGPGLALFYGGLVRRKNVLEHHDAQLHPDGAWSRCCGRSSATAWPSAEGSPFIGDLRYLFLQRRRQPRRIPITPPPFRSRPS